MEVGDGWGVDGLEGGAGEKAEGRHFRGGGRVVGRGF